jgi:hypothetical protein
VDEQVVNGEHERRIDRVRFDDRVLVRRSLSLSRELLGQGRRYATRRDIKKGAETAPFEVGSAFGEVVKV